VIEHLDGATRLNLIIGDPIAQVKSPAGVTALLQAKGSNAIVVPIHVSAADLDAFLKGMSLARNLDGIIVTVPHKFAAYRHCSTVSDRARFLQAVNVMRRNADGSWHGDMCDGQGFVAAIEAAGAILPGKRALLVGAGGAGSAIAYALVLAGVGALAVYDGDDARCDALITRLQQLDKVSIFRGSADPAGFDVIVNATPSGMRAGDPYPVNVKHLSSEMFVGDVVTLPAVPPLIAAARETGCKTQTGSGMFEKVRDLMVDFLLYRNRDENESLPLTG